MAHQDFNDDKKDAGDIGASHTVTAFYEVVPANKNAKGAIDDLKYSKVQTDPSNSDELLTLKIRYKQPGVKESKLISRVLKDEGKAFREAGGDFKFAAAVAMLGMDLRDSKHKGSSSAVEALQLAEAHASGDEIRQDFLKLARKAAAGLRSQNGETGQFRAEVTLQEIIVNGGLTNQEVKAVIRANVNQVRHCYETYSQRKPGTSGDVGFVSTINSAGMMGQVSITHDAFQDRALSVCIAGKLSRWKFPNPRGGEAMQVRGRFLLQHN